MDNKQKYHREQLIRIADQANRVGKAGLVDTLTAAADYIDVLHARLDTVKVLRDEFAMSAVTGMLARGEVSTAKHYATSAYQLADAMLEARNANR